MNLNDPKILIGIIIGLVVAFVIVLFVQFVRRPSKPVPSPIRIELSDLFLIYRDGAVAYASMLTEITNLGDQGIGIYSFQLKFGKRKLRLVPLKGERLPLMLSPFKKELFKLSSSALRPSFSTDYPRHIKIQVRCIGSGTKVYLSREYRAKAYMAKMR